MKNTTKTKQAPTIPHEVSKKLVLSFPPDTVSSGKRVALEAATAISEALRLFLVDAHHRALIEVSNFVCIQPYSKDNVLIIAVSHEFYFLGRV